MTRGSLPSVSPYELYHLCVQHVKSPGGIKQSAYVCMCLSAQ